MNKKLAIDLLAWYKDTVKMCKGKTETEIDVILFKRRVNCGMCHCAKHVFGMWIYGDNWIESIAPDGYFCDTPSGVREPAAKIEALKKRIAVLKTFSLNSQAA